MQSSVPARVLIVDDHPIVRQGLSELIGRHDGLKVTGQAADADAALELVRRNAFDVAIVDLSLPGLSGIELIRQLQVVRPDLSIIVLSMHEEQFYAERALRAGARAYVMKQESSERVVEAIRAVLQGEVFVSDDIAKRMLHRLVTGEGGDLQPVSRLSDRELEVFQLIGQGYSTRDVAEILNLSVKTIESYRGNIKEKLDLKNASELMQHAVKWVQLKDKD